MVASNDTQTGTASGARTERYRRAERAFWDHHDLLGKVIIRLPEKPQTVAKQLAGLGHATGGEPGQVPATFVDWRVAMTRETDWRRHERDMVRCVVGRGGFVPGFVLQDAEIAGIAQPTLMVYGTADPVGSVDIWRRFAARMPRFLTS